MAALEEYEDDLARYDFAGVAGDVMRIVDVPTAVVHTIRWAIIIPVLLGIATAAYFGGRMAPWALVPFVGVSVLLSLVGALFIGVLVVTRHRLEESTEATGRVLDTVARVHHDLVQLRGAEVTHEAVEDLALSVLRSGALEEAAAGFVPRPLRFIARPLSKPLVWGPRKIVERATSAVIDSMPWEVLDAKTAELTADTAASVDLLAEIRSGYDDAHARIESTVAAVIDRMTRPLTIVVVLSFVPVLVFWLIGDWLS